jgi:hypothetical protein
MATNSELQALVTELQKENMILKEKLRKKKNPTIQETSKLSYKKLVDRTGLFTAMLEVYATKPMTDEEVAIECGIVDDRHTEYWTKCNKLRKLGLIEWTGKKRRGTAGKLQQECRITTEGLNTIGKVRVVKK